MVDGTSYALIITFIIDLIIFSVLLILYTVYRKFRSKNISHITNAKVPPISESEQSLSEVWGEVWNTKLEEMRTKSSIESEIMLLMHKTILKMLLIYFIIGIGLSVVYAFGDSDTESDIELIGFAHISEDIYFLIAPTIALAINSIYSYYFIYKFVKKASKANFPQGIEYSKHVLEVTNFNKERKPEEIRSQIKNILQEKYDEIIVLPNYCQAHKTITEMLVAKVELAYYREFEIVKEERAFIKTKCLCCGKRDAIDFYQEKLDGLVEQAKREITEGNSENCGIVFLVSENIHNISENDISLLQKSGFSVKPGEDPSNFIWTNLEINQKKMKCKRFCLTLTFLIIFLIVVTPSAFLTYVSALLDSIGVGGAVQGLIGQFLPTILLAVYMSVILPMTIAKLVTMEKYNLKSDATMAAMLKFLIFMICHVFLVPAIGMQVIDVVVAILDDEVEELATVMVERLTESGLFFAVLVIHFGFLNNGFYLLEIGKLIGVYFKKKKALSDEARNLAYESLDFNFPLFYAESLTTYVIIVGFCIVFPLILPIGMLYFVLRYLFHKYNLLCIFYTEERESTSINVIKNTLMLGVLLFEVVTSGILMLTGESTYFYIGIVYIIAAFLMFFFGKWYLEKLIKVRKDDERESFKGIEISKDLYEFTLARERVDPATEQLIAPVVCPGALSFVFNEGFGI